MTGVNRATELASSLLHLGGLSATAAHLVQNDPWGALWYSLVTFLCVMLLSGGVILSSVARIAARQWVRKHLQDEPEPPDLRDEADRT